MIIKIIQKIVAMEEYIKDDSKESCREYSDLISLSSGNDYLYNKQRQEDASPEINAN